MEYTVSLQGTTFILSKDQIEFDSPNYFTAYFFGDFQQGHNRRVELPRDPDLFRIIYSYLCGYTVLPIDKHSIPKSMSPSLALLNLKADAEFYRLDGLVRACNDLVAQQELAQKFNEEHPNKYIVLGYTYDLPVFLDFDLLTVEPKSVWQLRVGQRMVLQDPLKNIKTVASETSFKTAAVVEELAARRLKEWHPREWRLVGWHQKNFFDYSELDADLDLDEEGEEICATLMVVVENLNLTRS